MWARTGISATLFSRVANQTVPVPPVPLIALVPRKVIMMAVVMVSVA